MFVRLRLLVNAGQKEVTKVGNGGRVQPSVRFLKKKKNACCCFCEYEMLSMKYRRSLFEAKVNKEE